MILFLNLLFAHLAGDFWSQTDNLCEQKRIKGFKSKFMYAHAFIIGLLAYAVSNAYNSFYWWALLICLSHLIIDIIKSHIQSFPVATFVVDQLIHVIVLALIAHFYLVFNDGLWSQFSFIPEKYQVIAPSLLCAIVICCGMSNILIKLVLKKFNIDLPKLEESEESGKSDKDRKDELSNAGALIGNLERLICLVFVLQGQYEAIGFLIAAKSILRYRDYEHSKTEYVLVGSMLSLFIAISCGMALSSIWSS